MQTQRHQGLAGLLKLREQWNSLHSSADLFARYEWHEACATYFLRDVDSLAYLQVLDGGGTVAIIPLISSIARVSLFGPLRTLSLGLHEHLLLADFQLSENADIDDVAMALAEALGAWPTPWDALSWPRALGTSNLMRLARRLRVHSVHITSAAPCNMLDTLRPYKDLHAGLSKNLRASLRKSQHRLEETGGATVTRNGIPVTSKESLGPHPPALGATSIQKAYDQFLSLEASGWKGAAGMGTAIQLNPGLRGFYRKLLLNGSQEFASEVIILERGDKAIAAQFSIRVKGLKHVLKIGYDESESQYSPGQMLMAQVLELASKEQITRVSLVTNMPWHAAWRPIAEPTFCVTVFRHRWRTILFRTYLDARRLAKLALARMPTRSSTR